MADDQNPNPNEPVEDEELDDTELASVVSTDEKGVKRVPLSSLIGSKRAVKELKKRIADLEPIAARVKDVDEKLGRVTPIVDAILTNPRLKAEAMRIASGTRTSAEATAQPEDDQDAQAYAEDAGFYLADNQTPDIARARRVLDRLDKRHASRTAEAIRPFAGLAVNQQVDANIRAIAAMTDADGVPYATEEGIREAVAALGQDGQRLLANPQVAQVVLRNAIGEDRFKGRTPKAPDEPLWMPHAGAGRRTTKEPAISQEQKARLAKLGLTEKEFAEASTKFDNAPRRGVVFDE